MVDSAPYNCPSGYHFVRMNLPGKKTNRQKLMTCWNCPRYDRGQFHCRDGKANPRKKTDAVMVAELLGLRALCHYNLYRDSIALRVHFPNDPVTIQASARVVKPKRFSIIEPDIAADYKLQETNV